jgi:signal transduction histidine kinase
MTRRRASIAGRLALISALLIAVALVVASAGLVLTLRQFVHGQLDQRLDAQLAGVGAALTRADGKLAVSSRIDGPPFDRPGSGWYWQADDGRQRVASASLGGETLAVPNWAPGWQDMFGLRPDSLQGDGPDGRLLYFRIQNQIVDGAPVTLVATAPAEALFGPVWQALFPVGATIVALGLALLGASVFQIRVGLKPLAALRDDVGAVRSGVRAHLPGAQPAELAPLVDELNRLIDQNAERLERARRHAANLGHALNTPLAGLALSLEEDGGEAAAGRLALVRRMQESIRHHLARARAAALGGRAGQRAELHARIADVAAALGKIHAERRIGFDGAASGDVYLACEPQDLDEMLGNLLDNAFKWAATRVRVRVEPAGRCVRIVIDDDGPGLEGDVLSLAMEPGRRLDEKVPGNGFGLSITRELAELYGGGLELARSPMGGLSVALSLPAAA